MSCLRKRILFRDIRDGLRGERRSRARNQSGAHRQGICIPSGATILAFGGIASFLPFQNQWNAVVFEPSRHGSSLIPKMDEPWAYVPQTIAGKWERRSMPNNIYCTSFFHSVLQISVNHKHHAFYILFR